MKLYYVQLSELRIAESRLKSLQERKSMLEAKITKTTSTIKEVVTSGGINSDKMTDYVIKCEELNKQIEDTNEEIEIIKKGLRKMDEILEGLTGIEERIFRLYYKENKNPTQISLIVPCGIATVYRYIKKFKEKYNNDKK